jgi:hypothetical protein
MNAGMAAVSPGIIGNPVPGQALEQQIRVWESTRPPLRLGEPSPLDNAPRFGIEKIANGFVVWLSRREGEVFEKHYAEDAIAVGNLVTATLTRWFIEGK